MDRPSLCILSPNQTYVSIGYHQEADREIDLGYCRAQDIPVIRRMVGGGAVLLDEGQIFFHLVVPHDRAGDLGLPPRLGERYERLTAPAIRAYRRLGVAAEFRPPNDIHVRGSDGQSRKIGGTGMADIGDALVFVGSMMLSFDHARMARVLRFHDDRLRGKVEASIAAGVTSLELECGVKPSRQAVHAALLAGFREELGADLEEGRLDVKEEARAAELAEIFASEEWLHRVTWSPERPRRLAVNCAVRYVEAALADLSVTARLVDGRIDEVLFGGGAKRLPLDAIEALRGALIGVTPGLEDVDRRIAEITLGSRYAAEGSGLKDLATLARKAVEAAR